VQTLVLEQAHLPFMHVSVPWAPKSGSVQSPSLAH
jgi:hypothetical protein